MNKILIVDDSRTSLFDIERKLIKINPEYKILSSESYEEAIDHLGREIVDLAFVDLQMPVKNGADLIMYMKSDDRFKDIPVMVLTGTGEDTLLKTSLKRIVNEYLHKPVDLDTLTKLTTNYLKPQ